MKAVKLSDDTYATANFLIVRNEEQAGIWAWLFRRKTKAGTWAIWKRDTVRHEYGEPIWEDGFESAIAIAEWLETAGVPSA